MPHIRRQHHIASLVDGGADRPLLTKRLVNAIHKLCVGTGIAGPQSIEVGVQQRLCTEFGLIRLILPKLPQHSISHLLLRQRLIVPYVVPRALTHVCGCGWCAFVEIFPECLVVLHCDAAQVD